MKTSIIVNDQDIAVTEFLKNNGVDYKAVYVKDNSQDKEWQHDLFNVSFTKGTKSFNTEFKTGLGHRVKQYKNGVTSLRPIYNKELAKVDLKGCLHKTDNDQFAVSPTSANVLYCLLLDADLSSEIFEDFCHNLGYDEDSLTAFEIYRQCQKNTTELRKIFDSSLQAELREILEDY